MTRTGTANLPLHYGSAPRWLFSRMTDLSREIVRFVAGEFGPDEVLVRLADPFWFQAFGCVLGFDWHSSGLTTTVCGALKKGLRGLENETGLFVAGGKGRTSRQTPQEILEHGEKHSIAASGQGLVYASKMSAKVDNTAVQDGYQLYHHCFFFSQSGKWSVVQQGMNPEARWARRYHWHSGQLQDFVCEPHTAICSDQRGGRILNMVAEEGEESRRTTALLAAEKPDKLAAEIEKMQTLSLPASHEVLVADLRPQSIRRILIKTYEQPPADFQQLLATQGVGPKTIRALASIADLVYGAQASLRDPAAFSFAHGGKDGHPYPVDRENYDRSIEILRQAVGKAKVGDRERVEALRRLAVWTNL